MSKKVRCERFPCDTAYRRGTHEPNEAGDVLHIVSCGHESRRAREDDKYDFPMVWRAEAIAWGEDGPWLPYVYVENQRRTFADPSEATRFAGDVQTAVTRALEANMREARQEAAELHEELSEALEQLQESLAKTPPPRHYGCRGGAVLGLGYLLGVASAAVDELGPRHRDVS